MKDNLKTNPASFRDYWHTALRRRWSFLGPLFLLGLAGSAVARVWPASYRSDALIIVEHQQVPTQYVTPNLVTDLRDRLQVMTQQTLSHTRLQRLIEQFRLYPKERARMTMDEVVEKMQADIVIDLVKPTSGRNEPNAFHVFYSAGNPRTAQQVNDELTRLFIEENLHQRTKQSESTTEFLEGQLEQARKDLVTQEARLREYKSSYLGELPEQEQSNLQILQSLEAQLHAGADALGRAEQQKIYLESMRAQYLAMQDSVAATDNKAASSPSAVAALALRDLQKELGELEAKYTSRHPDVQKLREQIDQWKALKQNVEAAPAGFPEGAGPTGNPALIEVDSRLKAVAAEIRDRKAEVEGLRKRIDQIQARLGLTPVREQQLAGVTRNYENSRKYYQSLLQKQLESALATNLEKRQEGEQFRIVDPPSLPQRPYQPNRLIILLVGWLVSLGGGIALVALRESADLSLRNEWDVHQHLQYPVLTQVPILRSPRVKMRLRWLRAIEVTGVALLVLASAIMGAFTFRAS